MMSLINSALTIIVFGEDAGGCSFLPSGLADSPMDAPGWRSRLRFVPLVAPPRPPGLLSGDLIGFPPPAMVEAASGVRLDRLSRSVCCLPTRPSIFPPDGPCCLATRRPSPDHSDSDDTLSGLFGRLTLTAATAFCWEPVRKS